MLLGESLKVCQHIPLLLLPDYSILDGWRRYLAALQVGIETLKAIICDRPLSETELRIVQATMSLHRSGLTPFEQYCLCFDLLELNPNWQLKDLGSHLKIDAAQVTRVMSVSKCMPAVREALKEGKINLSQVYAISQAAEENQAALLVAALEGKGRDALLRQKRKPECEVARTRRIHCDLPSGSSVTIAGEALSLDDVVDSLSEALKAAKKAVADGLDARTFSKVMAQKAKVQG